MALCPGCGSHRLRRVHHLLSPVMRIVAQKHRFKCSTCNWSGWLNKDFFAASQGDSRRSRRSRSRRGSSRGFSQPTDLESPVAFGELPLEPLAKIRKGSGFVRGDAGPAGSEGARTTGASGSDAAAADIAPPIPMPAWLKPLGATSPTIETGPVTTPGAGSDGAASGDPRAASDPDAPANVEDTRDDESPVDPDGTRSHHHRHPLHRRSRAVMRSRRNATREALQAAGITLAVLLLVWAAGKACSMAAPPPDPSAVGSQ